MAFIDSETDAEKLLRKKAQAAFVKTQPDQEMEAVVGDAAFASKPVFGNGKPEVPAGIIPDPTLDPQSPEDTAEYQGSITAMPTPVIDPDFPEQTPEYQEATALSRSGNINDTPAIATALATAQKSVVDLYADEPKEKPLGAGNFGLVQNKISMQGGASRVKQHADLESLERSQFNLEHRHSPEHFEENFVMQDGRSAEEARRAAVIEDIQFAISGTYGEEAAGLISDRGVMDAQYPPGFPEDPLQPAVTRAPGALPIAGPTGTEVTDQLSSYFGPNIPPHELERMEAARKNFTALIEREAGSEMDRFFGLHPDISDALAMDEKMDPWQYPMVGQMQSIYAWIKGEKPPPTPSQVKADKLAATVKPFKNLVNQTIMTQYPLLGAAMKNIDFDTSKVPDEYFDALGITREGKTLDGKNMSELDLLGLSGMVASIEASEANRIADSGFGWNSVMTAAEVFQAFMEIGGAPMAELFKLPFRGGSLTPQFKSTMTVLAKVVKGEMNPNTAFETLALINETRGFIEQVLADPLLGSGVGLWMSKFPKMLKGLQAIAELKDVGQARKLLTMTKTLIAQTDVAAEKLVKKTEVRAGVIRDMAQYDEGVARLDYLIQKNKAEPDYVPRPELVEARNQAVRIREEKLADFYGGAHTKKYKELVKSRYELDDSVVQYKMEPTNENRNRVEKLIIKVALLEKKPIKILPPGEKARKTGRTMGMYYPQRLEMWMRERAPSIDLAEYLPGGKIFNYGDARRKLDSGASLPEKTIQALKTVVDNWWNLPDKFRKSEFDLKGQWGDKVPDEVKGMSTWANESKEFTEAHEMAHGVLFHKPNRMTPAVQRYANFIGRQDQKLRGQTPVVVTFQDGTTRAGKPGDYGSQRAAMLGNEQERFLNLATGHSRGHHNQHVFDEAMADGIAMYKLQPEAFRKWFPREFRLVEDIMRQAPEPGTVGGWGTYGTVFEEGKLFREVAYGGKTAAWGGRGTDVIDDMLIEMFQDNPEVVAYIRGSRTDRKLGSDAIWSAEDVTRLEKRGPSSGQNMDVPGDPVDPEFGNIPDDLIQGMGAPGDLDKVKTHPVLEYAKEHTLWEDVKSPAGRGLGWGGELGSTPATRKLMQKPMYELTPDEASGLLHNFLVNSASGSPGISSDANRMVKRLHALGAAQGWETVGQFPPKFQLPKFEVSVTGDISKTHTLWEDVHSKAGKDVVGFGPSGAFPRSIRLRKLMNKPIYELTMDEANDILAASLSKATSSSPGIASDANRISERLHDFGTAQGWEIGDVPGTGLWKFQLPKAAVKPAVVPTKAAVKKPAAVPTKAAVTPSDVPAKSPAPSKNWEDPDVLYAKADTEMTAQGLNEYSEALKNQYTKNVIAAKFKGKVTPEGQQKIAESINALYEKAYINSGQPGYPVDIVGETAGFVPGSGMTPDEFDVHVYQRMTEDYKAGKLSPENALAYERKYHPRDPKQLEMFPTAPVDAAPVTSGDKNILMLRESSEKEWWGNALPLLDMPRAKLTVDDANRLMVIAERNILHETTAISNDATAVHNNLLQLGKERGWTVTGDPAEKFMAKEVQAPPSLSKTFDEIVRPEDRHVISEAAGNLVGIREIPIEVDTIDKVWGTFNKVLFDWLPGPTRLLLPAKYNKYNAGAATEMKRVRLLLKDKGTVAGLKFDAGAKVFDINDAGQIMHVDLSHLKDILKLPTEPTIQDIAARYPLVKGFLNPEQKEFMELLRKEMEDWLGVLKEYGLDPGVRDDVFRYQAGGGFYVPRGRANEEGIDSAIKKTMGRGPGKPVVETAEFDSMAHGLDKKQNYSRLGEAILSYYESKGEQVLQAHLANYFKSLGVVEEVLGGGKRLVSLGNTFRDRMMITNPDVVKNMERAQVLISQVKYLEDSFGVVQSEALTAFLTSPTDLDIAAFKKWIQGMKAEGDQLQRVKGELLEIVEEMKRPFNKAAKAAAEVNPGMVINLTGLEDMSFDTSIAHAINNIIKEAAPRKEGGVGGAMQLTSELAQAYNKLYVGLKATGDMSFLGLQGLLTAYHSPKVAGQAFKVGLEAWADPNVLGQFIIAFDKAAVDATRRGNKFPTSSELAGWGLHIGADVHDFRLGSGPLSKIQKIPGVQRANRAFGFQGDANRLALARDFIVDEMSMGRTLDEIVESGDMERITYMANRMTGYSTKRSFGTVGDFLLFAPRFLQSRLETLTKAGLGLRPGAPLDQKIARRSMVRMVTRGILLAESMQYMINGEPLDHRPIVDGRMNPNFLKIRAFGRDWSVFGPWESMVRMFIEVGGGIKSLDAPRMGRIVWGMGSGIVAQGNTFLFQQETFTGKPTRISTEHPLLQAEQTLRMFIYSHMPISLEEAPFSIHRMMEGMREGDWVKAASGPASILGEIFAANNHPLSITDLRDSVSGHKYGMRYDDPRMLKGHQDMVNNDPQVKEVLASGQGSTHTIKIYSPIGSDVWKTFDVTRHPKPPETELQKRMEQHNNNKTRIMDSILAALQTKNDAGEMAPGIVGSQKRFRIEKYRTEMRNASRAVFSDEFTEKHFKKNRTATADVVAALYWSADPEEKFDPKTELLTLDFTAYTAVKEEALALIKKYGLDKDYITGSGLGTYRGERWKDPKYQPVKVAVERYEEALKAVKPYWEIGRGFNFHYADERSIWSNYLDAPREMKKFFEQNPEPMQSGQRTIGEFIKYMNKEQASMRLAMRCMNGRVEGALHEFAWVSNPVANCESSHRIYQQVVVGRMESPGWQNMAEELYGRDYNGRKRADLPLGDGGVDTAQDTIPSQEPVTVTANGAPPVGGYQRTRSSDFDNLGLD